MKWLIAVALACVIGCGPKCPNCPPPETVVVEKPPETGCLELGGMEEGVDVPAFDVVTDDTCPVEYVCLPVRDGAVVTVYIEESSEWISDAKKLCGKRPQEGTGP